jgi:hypothetical protein
MWEAVAMLVISAIISYALMPKMPVTPPESFTDIEFPQTDEGTAQAVIFGDVWSGDWVVLNVGNYRTTAIEKDGGGK